MREQVTQRVTLVLGCFPLFAATASCTCTSTTNAATRTFGQPSNTHIPAPCRHNRFWISDQNCPGWAFDATSSSGLGNKICPPSVDGVKDFTECRYHHCGSCIRSCVNPGWPCVVPEKSSPVVRDFPSSLLPYLTHSSSPVMQLYRIPSGKVSNSSK